MFFEGLFDERIQCRLKVVRFFKNIGELLEFFGDDRVEHDVRAGDGKRGTEHPEFEFVARKGEGGSPVAVGGVFRKMREDMDANLHFRTSASVVGCSVLDGIEDRSQLVAKEHRNDGRGVPRLRRDDGHCLRLRRIRGEDPGIRRPP